MRKSRERRVDLWSVFVCAIGIGVFTAWVTLVPLTVAPLRQIEQRFLLVGAIKDLLPNNKKLLYALHTAEEGDRVHITVRSPGGSTYGLAGLVSAMERTKAHTTVYIGAVALSAAADFSCYAKELIVSPYAYVMFHRSSYNVTGELVPLTSFYGVADERIFERCKRFFTEEQLKKYYAGEDVYISPDAMNNPKDVKSPTRPIDLLQERTND